MARESRSRSPGRERPSHRRRDNDVYERTRRYRDDEDEEERDGRSEEHRASKIAKRDTTHRDASGRDRDRERDDDRDDSSSYRRGRYRDEERGKEKGKEDRSSNGGDYGRRNGGKERRREGGRAKDYDDDDAGRSSRRANSRSPEPNSYNRRRDDERRERGSYRDREDHYRERDRRERDDRSGRDRADGPSRRRSRSRSPRAYASSSRKDKDKYKERSANNTTTRRDEEDAQSDSEDEKDKKDKEKGKPNFKPSGLLAAATNTVALTDGTKTVLKYNEPPEARKPAVGWRLYVFKEKDQSDVYHIYRQSCYLIGRDKAVVDIYVEHPSCSKQHAAIQFRQVMRKDEYGNSKATVKPYIIDLESTNGTHVNGEPVPAAQFYELQMNDVIRFGQSTRDYVLVSEDAAAAA